MLRIRIQIRVSRECTFREKCENFRAHITSIFEVLLCHINYFSPFTLKNVWRRDFDFISYLFKFLSVFFPRNFCIIYASKFSRHFFICLHFLFRENLAFFCKKGWSEISQKNENFLIFREQMKCEMKWNGREKIKLRRSCSCQSSYSFIKEVSKQS